MKPSNPAAGVDGPAFSRREFLRAASAGIGTLALAQPAMALGSAPQVFGVQLYTLRDIMQSNMDYVLRQVHAIGYREVEFAGLFDREPKKVKFQLDKIGLTSPASHISLDRLKANLPGVVDEAQTLGNQYVVCPWVDGAARKDAAGWRRVAADFNRIGESLQRVGLRFAYHNHDFEFQPLPGGEIGYDILLAETDPKVVRLELDLYWITKARKDPLAYFAQYPNRFPIVHVKDMAGNGTIANVGQGHIDWGRIFAKRREAGIEHFFIERDNPKDPLADIKASYDYVIRLGL